jgi:hypothetical protein
MSQVINRRSPVRVGTSISVQKHLNEERLLEHLLGRPRLDCAGDPRIYFWLAFFLFAGTALGRGRVV